MAIHRGEETSDWLMEDCSARMKIKWSIDSIQQKLSSPGGKDKREDDIKPPTAIVWSLSRPK